MSKFLNKFKGVFTKKILKRVLGIFILLGIGSMSFYHNQVNAQSNDNNAITTQEKQEDKILNANEFFNTILQLVYVLIWPVLVIIGWLIDNTVVYGSFLHLDASLWTLWNIVKNFANFALGFLVLFAIVKNVISPLSKGSSDKWKPVTIIKNTLIAGILIQASWFLMAAIIDVSTILTYSIGGMPMTILQNSPATKDVPIIGVNARLESQDGGKSVLSYYNTYGDAKISPCVTKKLKGFTGDYIVGKKQIMIDEDNHFNTGLCTIGSWPYKFDENPSITGEDNDSYQQSLRNYFETTDTNVFSGLIADCHAIPLYKNDDYNICQGYGILDKDDTFFSSTTSNDGTKLTLDGLLEKSKGFVGPFITMYSSILDFTTITEPVEADSNLFNSFFNLIIKFFFAVALFFPLLALAVVLLARVGILWLAIAASPAIVLVTVFGNVLGGGDKILGKHLNIKNLMQLIFAPVFVVFAISMSLIFLSALNPRSIDVSDNFEEEQLAVYGIESSDQSYSILGIVEVEMDMDKISKGKDTFAWFITNLFAVGVVWFFLFFAIKQMTGEVGKSVGKAIQDSVKNMAMNLPVIPVAGGIGISATESGVKSLGGIPDKITRKQEQKLKEKYPWLYDMSAQDTNRGETGDGTFHGMDIGLQRNIFDAKANGKGFDTIFAENKTALTAAGITSATALEESYNNIYNYNTDSIVEKTSEDVVDTFEAQKYTSESISLRANQTGSKWNSWAKGAVGSNVQTNEGVYVMTNVGTFSSPEFKLLVPAEYNKRYLTDVEIKEDGDIDREKLKDNISAYYNDSQTKPDDVEEADWNTHKDKYIEDQIKKHMENAEKRLKTDNSGSNNNNQETS